MTDSLASAAVADAGSGSRPRTLLTRADRPTVLTIAVSSGLAFLACWLPAPDAPKLDAADADTARAWISANSTALRVSALAILLVAVALLVTAAGLTALARRHLAASLLTEAVLGCAAVVAVILTLDVAATTTGRVVPQLLDTTTAQVSDPVIVGWLAVGGYAHYVGDLNMAFISVLLVCASLLVARLRLTKRWLCYLGVALGVGGALGVVGLVLAVPGLYVLWFAAMFGLYLGLLVLCVSCVIAWRRLGRASPADPATPPA